MGVGIGVGVSVGVDVGVGVGIGVGVFGLIVADEKWLTEDIEGKPSIKVLKFILYLERMKINTLWRNCRS